MSWSVWAAEIWSHSLVLRLWLKPKPSHAPFMPTHPKWTAPRILPLSVTVGDGGPEVPGARASLPATYQILAVCGKAGAGKTGVIMGHWRAAVGMRVVVWVEQLSSWAVSMHCCIICEVSEVLGGCNPAGGQRRSHADPADGCFARWLPLVLQRSSVWRQGLPCFGKCGARKKVFADREDELEMA